jgi:hypothetical protein
MKRHAGRYTGTLAKIAADEYADYIRLNSRPGTKVTVEPAEAWDVFVDDGDEKKNDT